MLIAGQTTYLIAILFVFSIIGIGSSSCSKKTSNMPSNEVRYSEALKYAQSILGSSSKVIVNEEGTLFLCLKNMKPRVQFVVTDLDKKTVLAKQSANGTVKWNDSSSLSVQDLPTVLQDKSSKPSDFIKIIELNQSL